MLTFDLKGQALKPDDTLKLYVKDWEMIGRNRWELLLIGLQVIFVSLCEQLIFMTVKRYW